MSSDAPNTTARACGWCGHPVSTHRDSWEWREETNMRECLTQGCDCRLFWDRGEVPPAHP